MKNTLVLRWAVVLVALVVLTSISSCAAPTPAPTVASTTAPTVASTAAPKATVASSTTGSAPTTAPVEATKGPTIGAPTTAPVEPTKGSTVGPTPTQAPITCKALDGALACDVRSVKCQFNGITGTCIQFTPSEKPPLSFFLVIPTQKENQPLSVESVKFANDYPTPVGATRGRLLANFKIYGDGKKPVSKFDPPLLVVAEYDQGNAPKLLMYDTRWTILDTSRCEGDMCPKYSVKAPISSYDEKDPCVAFGE